MAHPASPGMEGAVDGGDGAADAGSGPRVFAVAKRSLDGGHEGDVLACDAAANLVASAGEDGCTVWDTRQRSLVARFGIGLFGDNSGDSPLSSVIFPGASSGTTPGDPVALCVSHGPSVSSLDLRRPGAVAATSGAFAEDEVNQVVCHDKGAYLACADDAGDVTVLTYPGLAVHKRLARAHDNLCTSVQFRPRRPWDVVSGAMDGTVCQWDFSRTQCVSQTGLNASREAGASVNPEDDPSEVPSLGQGFNPALVQSLAMGRDGHWLAAGAHNGSVHVLSFRSGKARRGSRAFGFTSCVSDAHAGSAAQVHCPRWDGGGDNALVSGGDDAKLRFWTVRSPYHPCICPSAPPCKPVYALSSDNCRPHNPSVTYHLLHTVLFNHARTLRAAAPVWADLGAHR